MKVTVYSRHHLANAAYNKGFLFHRRLKKFFFLKESLSEFLTETLGKEYELIEKFDTEDIRMNPRTKFLNKSMEAFLQNIF